MSDKMFRYLEKYVGKYRVLAHYDTVSGDFPRDEDGKIDESYDDLYIKTGRQGEIRGTYKISADGDVILCWYTISGQTGRNVFKELKSQYPKIYLEKDDLGTYDYFIYFEEKDIDKIVNIVGANTAGAKIKPYSIKNLPKPPYEIPEKDLKLYNDITKNLEQKDKMLFGKKVTKDFDSIIQEKKGKKYNVNQERNNSHLKNKEFIHSVGLWKEFITFTKTQLKEYLSSK